MITNLETAVVNYLTTELGADSSLSGVVYEIRGATSRDPIAGDRLAVIVSMEGVPRTITVLAEAMADLIVYAPMNVDGVTVANLKKLEAAIEKAFDRAVNTDATTTLNAAVAAAASGWAGAGFHPEGWQQGREETNFMPAFRVKVGAVRSL